MIKCISNTIVLISILAAASMTNRYFHIKRSYESIVVPIPASEVLKIMGNPNIIYPETETDKHINWLYFQFPDPTGFIFTIQDGIVISKGYQVSA